MTNAGQIIRAIRKSKKMTQTELSEASGVPMVTISVLERRIRDCKLSTFEKVLEGMGYEIEIMRKEE